MRVSQSMLTCVLVVSLCKPYFCDHISEIFLGAIPCHGQMAVANRRCPGSLTLTLLPPTPVPPTFPEPYVQGLFVDLSTGDGYLPHSRLFPSYWPVVGFCNMLYLLQNEASLMRDESYIYLWIERRTVCRMKLGIILLKSLASIGFPMSSGVSVAIGFWTLIGWVSSPVR